MEQIRLTAELLAEEWGFHELDRMARAGEVQRIRRGAYECAPAKSLERREQHRRLIAATLRQTSVDAVFEEKRREGALRDLGWQIVRWIWQDLYHPEDLRRRLERAFERGLRAA
jgi:hypothetical protein